MKFISTKNKELPLSFRQAVELGLAPDGGLIVPESFPRMDVEKLLKSYSKNSNLATPSNLPSLIEVSAFVLNLFLGDEFSKQEIQTLAERSFDFPVPLNQWDEHTFCLELFHGPTAAFKDVAAQFISQFMDFAVPTQQTILVATSGDTGGAIASAFNGHPRFQVVVLFPVNGVSPLQKHQLTCWSENVISLGVEGSFDDCQRMVKALLADKHLIQRYHLTSANSINIARLLPQACYYGFSSICSYLQTQKKANFFIPTGNMGNAVGAFWAKEMGFPIHKIGMATNANKVVSDFFQTGKFAPSPSVPTLANAMDVGNPSNFERLVHLHGDFQSLKNISVCESVSDQEIRQAILEVHSKYKKIICPHTATAYHLRTKFQKKAVADETAIGEPAIIVATAHPAKFKEVMNSILIDVNMDLPLSLQGLFNQKSHFHQIKPDIRQVMEFLHDA